MIQLVIEAGDCVKLRSGGPTMTVETVDQGVATCVWADKQGRIRRDNLRVSTLKMSGDPDFEGVADLVIEGVTHSPEEMRAMGLKH